MSQVEGYIKYTDAPVITNRTMAIVPITYGSKIYSRIFEVDGKTIESPYEPLKIIKINCGNYCKSFAGAQASIRERTRFKNKLPVVFDVLQQVCLFPTESPESKSCYWFHPYHCSENIRQSPSQHIIVTLTDRTEVEIDISENVYKKQKDKTKVIIKDFLYNLEDRKTMSFITIKNAAENKEKYQS